MSYLSLTSIHFNDSLKQDPNNGSISMATTSKQLVELAAEQKSINYFLCLFHSQLIRILYLTAKYNIKSVKPLSFFDTKV